MKYLFFLKVHPCPTSDPRYHIVDGLCLYYENTRLNFDDAIQNCHTKFQATGRLFEPKTVAINKKAHKTGVDNVSGFDCGYQIGYELLPLNGLLTFLGLLLIRQKKTTT